VFEVKSTNGDTFLGARISTPASSDYLADEFRKGAGHRPAQGQAGPPAPERRRRKSKIELSSSMQTESQSAVHTRPTSRTEASEHQADARQLEALVDELIQKTVDPCRAALKDAGLKASEINEVHSGRRMSACRR